MGNTALLVPAHNEEAVIGETLKALRVIAPPSDIYVVNDGSSDKTETEAKKWTKNVLTLLPNRGKAAAINLAISHFALTERYPYIMPMDADTVITPNFLTHTLPILENDKKSEFACVVGRVTGRSFSWVTAYRLWEYEVAQTIHKTAQAKENAIIVCPGCATVYRSKIFVKYSIPTETLTEDMDFTFLIHRKKIGKIGFTNKAVVITQDPGTLKDFIKQLDRWYTGFWQCVRKHNIPWGGQTLDAEVGLLASEGLFNGILVLMLFFLVPITLLNRPFLLALPLSMDLFIFVIPTMILTSWRSKNFKIMLYIPHLYLMRLLSSLVFLKSFFKEVLGTELKRIWNKATRYQIKEAF